MWARAVPYGEFGRLRREARRRLVSGATVHHRADLAERATDADVSRPPGEAFDFVDAVAKEAHRVQVHPDPAP